MENGEKQMAPTKGRHEAPARESAGILGKGEADGGRKFAFGFHRGKDLFGDLVSAAGTGGGIPGAVNQVSEPFADGMAEAIEPAAEGAVCGEVALEFGRDDDGPRGDVGFECEFGGGALQSARGFLHFFIDQEIVDAVARGKE